MRIERNYAAIRFLRMQIVFHDVKLRLHKDGYRERYGRMWMAYRTSNLEPLFAFSECDLWEREWKDRRGIAA